MYTCSEILKDPDNQVQLVGGEVQFNFKASREDQENVDVTVSILLDNTPIDIDPRVTITVIYYCCISYSQTPIL